MKLVLFFCTCRDIEGERKEEWGVKWSNLQLLSTSKPAPVPLNVTVLSLMKSAPPNNGNTFVTQVKKASNNHESSCWTPWLYRKSRWEREEEEKTLPHHLWPQFRIVVIIFNNMLPSGHRFYVQGRNLEFRSCVWVWVLMPRFIALKVLRTIVMLHLVSWYHSERWLVFSSFICGKLSQGT